MPTAHHTRRCVWPFKGDVSGPSARSIAPARIVQGQSIWLLGIFLLAITGPGCRQTTRPTDVDQPSSPPWFVEVTQEVGLNFVHDAGPLPGDRYFMPQIMGSGAALLDFDQDGRLDIYLIQNAGPRSKSTNRLFRQTDQARFVDVTAGSGLDIAGHGMGVAIGDINNDGRPDVLVTEYGGIRLFLN